ncbi:MAG: tetratricopeptide repeat protein [Candidatus Heimdallarchaeota archaeon]|nr:tetratricopeptide repeat protein [Candidatus Heimdallarchaeota archaeon]
MDDGTEIITQIEMIISRYHEIDGEGLGPWSEVSEVMEQEREAERYIAKIKNSKLQQKLSKAINDSVDPWEYIEYIVRSYYKGRDIQPNKFFNSIIECDVVIESITQIIPKISDRIPHAEDPAKMLKFLITVNSKNRESKEIKHIVKKMMERKNDVDSFLISHSLRLSKVEANVISKIEEITGRIPLLDEISKASVKKDTIYSLGAINHIEWGYSLENGKIVSLGLNHKEVHTLPDCLVELTNLRLLSLNGLGLNSIPESIGNLTKLEGLYLDSNNIEFLPESLGNCTELKEIYIRSNNLETLPDEISNLNRLHLLNLTNNPLISLPSTFENLSNLEDLYIQNTKLSFSHIIPLNKLKKLGLRFVYDCLADNLIQYGKQGEAAEVYDVILKVEPDDEEALFKLGNIHNSLGKYVNAEKLLQKAVKSEKYGVEASISLGFTYFALSKLDKAEVVFKKALELNKTRVNEILILLNLGGLFITQGRLVDAEKVLFDALALDSSNGEIHYNLSCLFARKDDNLTSLKYLQKAIRFNASLLLRIDSDSDFDNLRSTDEFQRLISEYKSSVEN